MTKEQILEDIKDLVQTLRSPNFQIEKVKGLWREKSERVLSLYHTLNSSDLLWLSKKYKEWYNKVIEPTMSEEEKKFTNRENFPWI